MRLIDHFLLLKVGVGLMLHAKKYHEEAMEEKAKQKIEVKDSGYITATTVQFEQIPWDDDLTKYEMALPSFRYFQLSTTDSGDRRRSSFSVLAKAVQSTQRLARFRGRGATFAFRSKAESQQSKDKGVEKKAQSLQRVNNGENELNILIDLID